MAFCIVDHAALSWRILENLSRVESQKRRRVPARDRGRAGMRSKIAMLSKSAWQGAAEECEWNVLVVVERASLLMEVLRALLRKLVDIVVMKRVAELFE